MARLGAPVLKLPCSLMTLRNDFNGLAAHLSSGHRQALQYRRKIYPCGNIYRQAATLENWSRSCEDAHNELRIMATGESMENLQGSWPAKGRSSTLQHQSDERYTRYRAHAHGHRVCDHHHGRAPRFRPVRISASSTTARCRITTVLRRSLRRNGVHIETENDSEVRSSGTLQHRDESRSQLRRGNSKTASTTSTASLPLLSAPRTDLVCSVIPSRASLRSWPRPTDTSPFGSEYRALVSLPSIDTARVWEPEPANVYFWER